MRSDPDLARVARGVGQGFTVMLVGGLLVFALAGVLGPATGILLTATAAGAFVRAAWETADVVEGGLAGGGTYLLFLPLSFLGEGDPPHAALIVPLLLGAAAVGAGTGWWRGSRTGG